MKWEKLSKEIKDNNWKTSDIKEGFCLSNKGIPLFFLQSGRNESGKEIHRIVFNQPLANEYRIDFNEIMDGYSNSNFNEKNTISTKFKDNNGYEMVFSNSKTIFTKRFWEETNFKNKEAYSATFLNINTAEAFFSNISKNFINDIKNNPDIFNNISNKINDNFILKDDKTKKFII